MNLKRFYQLLTFILTFTQALTVTINNLIVPDIIESGVSNSIVLECDYSSVDRRQCSVQWKFNRSESIYEWKPGSQPVVGGVLNGHFGLDYRSIMGHEEEYGNIHIVDLVPELSGEYTCKVSCEDGTEADQTKTMLVYSPEKDIELKITQHHNAIEVKCNVVKVFPQPELSLELRSQVIPKQDQRVWRSEDKYFDAESTAMLPIRVGQNANITCRLSLPKAGYMAMKMDVFNVPKHSYNSAQPTHCYTIILTFGILNKISEMYL